MYIHINKRCSTYFFLKCDPIWFFIVCLNLNLNCFNFTVTYFKGLAFSPLRFLFFVPASGKGASQGALSKNNFCNFFFSYKDYMSPENGRFGPQWTASCKNRQDCLSAKKCSWRGLHKFWRKGLKLSPAVSEPLKPFVTIRRDNPQNGTFLCTFSDKKAGNMKWTFTIS